MSARPAAEADPATANRLERLQQVLRERVRRDIDVAPPLLRAGVLIPLLWRGPEVELLFTRRTDTVLTHKGQISFPGGQREDADTWHLLGRLRIWLKRKDAAPAFARAAALDPEHYVVPYRVNRERFSRLAEDALAAIPERFQALLSNTLVVVDELPELESVRSGEDPDLLGLYEGGTVLERGLPERIVLYQRNHENICADDAELAEQVAETMLHEVGHHFGMAEDELPF